MSGGESGGEGMGEEKVEGKGKIGGGTASVQPKEGLAYSIPLGPVNVLVIGVANFFSSELVSESIK